jgi:murein DD-endopeptidase MepM/ murein hydrolase activator NlpD
MYTFPLPGWSGPIELHWKSDTYPGFPGASDLMAPIGQPVVSIGAGTVSFAGYDDLGGNAVDVKGDDGLEYYYAHLRDAPLVKEGQSVQSGTPLGYVGDTGNAAGGPSHLHIGIGKTILTGSGATGGAGSDFDAVQFLRDIFAGKQPLTGSVTSGTQAADPALGILGFFAAVIKWLASLVTGGGNNGTLPTA